MVMIDDSMLKAAEAEVIRLQEELEKTPAYKRLQAALALIAVYREDASAPAPVSSVTAPHHSSWTSSHEAAHAVWGTPSAPVAAGSTKTARVEAAVTEYLLMKGRRATSGELLPVVTAKGITITGKVPSKTMASYLSTSKKFDNVPAFGGYGLIEWNKRRGPATSAASENSTGNPEKGGSGLFS
jgi:hypothetical protein